ncbi:MAG: UDP-N-acetylmuramoyl-tripeptide--D-alanyl-D-alanine ligase, partial [Candidatus Rokubacteria bacterium]|nr:UDP-N-acetylmuramoyl-tripeptide--D-alanyl-D-alanine ligase [Candidatus Rokubacteria bacterium]
MSRFTLEELAKGSGGRLVSGPAAGELTGVSIDSRTLRPGEAFVAIRGHRLDGHAFCADALEKGAGALVVADPAAAPPTRAVPVILVDDSTLALQRLARFHRARFELPVVAITGSNGKTTTKELTAAVLSVRFRVLKSEGSLNNQWGVPLTLLRLAPEHEALVIEIGMSALGEIATLAALAQPTIGVLTNIGPVHLEFLGSLEAVQKAKGELVRAIGPEGTVVLNADDPLVLALAKEARGRVVTFGFEASAHVRARGVARGESALAFTLVIGVSSAPVSLPLAGRHNVSNALAAAAVGSLFGLAPREIAEGLGRARPAAHRLTWIDAGGTLILDDCYNANPSSVAAALETLVEEPGVRTIAVLGDMLELGAAAEAAHLEVGRLAARLGVERLYGF